MFKESSVIYWTGRRCCTCPVLGCLSLSRRFSVAFCQRKTISLFCVSTKVAFQSRPSTSRRSQVPTQALVPCGSFWDSSRGSWNRWTTCIWKCKLFRFWKCSHFSLNKLIYYIGQVLGFGIRKITRGVLLFVALSSLASSLFIAFSSPSGRGK